LVDVLRAARYTHATDLRRDSRCPDREPRLAARDLGAALVAHRSEVGSGGPDRIGGHGRVGGVHAPAPHDESPHRADRRGGGIHGDAVARGGHFRGTGLGRQTRAAVSPADPRRRDHRRRVRRRLLRDHGGARHPRIPFAVPARAELSVGAARARSVSFSMAVPADLLDKISYLPESPGVYLWRDAEGAVLYVGKAKRLRSRVRSYVTGDHLESVKTRALMLQVAGLETIVVPSEAHALILEANLIKEYHPKYNIALRDDKSYPYIKVTVAEPFPRVWVTRRLVDDG